MSGIIKRGFISSVSYNFFTGELKYIIKTTNLGCPITSTCTQNFSNTDDAVLLVCLEKSLQTLIDNSSLFALEHDIIYHATKSVSMIIWLERKRLVEITEFSSLNVTLIVIKNSRILVTIS